MVYQMYKTIIINNWRWIGTLRVIMSLCEKMDKNIFEKLAPKFLLFSRSL